MSLERILGMAGGAMDAQSKRLSLAVENIANSDVVSGDKETAYKAKRVNFATILRSKFYIELWSYRVFIDITCFKFN